MEIMIKVFFLMIGFLTVFTFGYSAGFYRGEVRGMDKQVEEIKKAQCKFDYGDVAQKDIPGKCLKYFIKGE